MENNQCEVNQGTNPKIPISEEELRNLLVEIGFDICHEETSPAKNAVNKNYEDLLSEESSKFLSKKGLTTLWRHQYEAVKYAKAGKNICVSTSTSSGKTEIFFLSAIEMCERDKTAKILAIYPMKALNAQQLDRWRGTGLNVGRIDGGVPLGERTKILKDQQVVVMTPDVVNAWLLSHINDGKEYQDFIRNIKMVIMDEIHLYKGLFGTNVAYMLRRLNNVRRKLKPETNSPQYITASATLLNPCEHAENITGIKGFINIGADLDGSPSVKKTFFYVKLNSSARIREVTQLPAYIAERFDENTRSITFMNSRQKVAQNLEENNRKKGIFPFRGGFDESTRQELMDEFNRPECRGIISTSALEIGIDIAKMNVAIIADIPYDINSYNQRIGRVGRMGSGDSYVIIVKDKSFRSGLLFDDFNYDITKVLPEYSPLLYLDDEQIQYIHAACHVGYFDSCEYKVNRNKKFDGHGYFPESFVKLCNDIIIGQKPTLYDEMMEKVDCRPQWTFSLRNFGDQYHIYPTRSAEKDAIPDEDITRENLILEAYPGAVRTGQNGTRTIKERVYRVVGDRIYVRKEQRTTEYINQDGEKRIRKQPSYHITYPVIRKTVVPNFRKSHGELTTLKCGDALIMNLNVTERATVFGFTEKDRWAKDRGYYHKYGSEDTDNEGLSKPIYLQNDKFYPKDLNTTGTILFHPALNGENIENKKIADILFETFLVLNTFDRNDISHIACKAYISYPQYKINPGNKFITLYDTCRLLNITRHLTKDKGFWLKEMFQYLNLHKKTIIGTVCNEPTAETEAAIDELCNTFCYNEIESVGEEDENVNVQIYDAGCEAVYLKRSKGVDIENVEERDTCLVMGRGSEDNTYNILVNGNELLKNIAADDLEPTEKSRFVTLK